MTTFTPAETWTRETYKARDRWQWVASISYNTIFDLSRYLGNVGAQEARAAALAAYSENVYEEACRRDAAMLRAEVSP